MKRLTATLMAALMVLTVFAGVASAAMTVDSVEVRGPVFNGSDIGNIVTEYGDGTQVEVNATNFAGFWYDIDENQATEYIYISNESSEDGRELVENKGLVYKTYINETDYDAFNGSFPIMGYFAEKYVPLTNETPDKLAKLMLDNDDKHTLRVGNSLELGNGYELTASQVDVDGKQVWMELTKDGNFVDDNIFDLDEKSEEVWTYEEDVAGEDDVEVLKVKVTSVFQGQVDSLAQIEGLWMIDWDNTMELDSDDERGELERTDSSSSDYLKYYNSDDISLDEDSTIELAEDLTIKVADDSSALRFYVLKEYIDPGTYEVRGTVAGDGETNWTANDFAGFWYDLDDDQSTEMLKANVSSREMAETGGLVYKTSIEETGYDAFKGNFPIMGYFAEKYVPLTNETPDKLAKLMLDNDDKHTLRVGESLDLGNGYELTAQQVDVDGEQVWMDLTKDGDSVDDNIFDLSGDADEEVWTYEEDVAGEDDVEVLKVKVTSVFQGQVDSLAQIEGLWMIDWDNAMEIDSDDERGELERTDSSSSDYLMYYNSDDISLDEDETINIAEEMYIQVADNSSVLRYYPFVDMTIEGEMEEEVDDTEDKEEETNVTDDAEEDVTDDAEEDVTDDAEEDVTDDAEEDVTDDAEEDVTDDAEEEPADTPGFEAVFAIAGLLAVAYLVRRN